MGSLLLANEAIALGAYEADVKVVSSYPGTPSTEITESASKYDSIYTEWAPNEKVALEVAIGACFSGVRSMCCMKHVGLNVAADPLFTLSYTGVNAGLVIVVADDPGMHSSQNEQDSRYYALSAHIPMLEPADSSEARDFVKIAYIISEKYDTPVIIRLTTRIAHSRSFVEPQERIEIQKKPYVKDVSKYVMMPSMARFRHLHVEKRENDLSRDISLYNTNSIVLRSQKLGIVCSGAVYQYVMEASDASVFKLGMIYPIDFDAVRTFASQVQELIVVEELEPFFEKELLSQGIQCHGKEIFGRQGEFCVSYIKQKLEGGLTTEKIKDKIPQRPPVMCAGCPHRSVFYALKKLKIKVCGDIGCYALGALEPLSSVDLCVCMGASIGMAHGFDKGNTGEGENTVAVIGDSTFLHSGINSLINSTYNNGTSTIVILDNSITAMTGHQDNPSTGITIKGQQGHKIDLYRLCLACGAGSVRVVDAYNIQEVTNALKEEISNKCVSVIIARRPCALLNKKYPPAYFIESKKCIYCKQCLAIGCPAIENLGNSVRINKELCVGCGVCTQMCKFEAIISEGK